MSDSGFILSVFVLLVSMFALVSVDCVDLSMLGPGKLSRSIILGKLDEGNDEIAGDVGAVATMDEGGVSVIVNVVIGVILGLGTTGGLGTIRGLGTTRGASFETVD